MATNVGMLTIEMAANIARLQKDMNSATKTVDSAMSKINKSVEMAQKALGALGVGLSISAFSNFIKQAINVADESNKMSQKIGVAVSDLAGLQLAFRQAGVDSGGFQQGMTKLSVSVASGSKAFEAMGISTKNADGSLKSTRQVLMESADKFASYKDGIDKTALAVEIFGKAGANLIPLLNQGSKGIEEYDRKAKQLGLTLNSETARAAEEFNDQLDLLGAASQGFATQLAAALLPALKGTINVLLDLAKVINDNKEYLIAYAAVFTSGALIAALPAIATGFMSVAAGITAVTVAMAKNPVALAIMLLTAAAIPAIDALVKMYKESKKTAEGVEKVAEATGKAAPSLKEMEEGLKKNIEAAKLANEAWDEYFKTLEEGRLTIEKGIKTAREIVEDLEFEEKALKMTNAEREIAIRLRKIEAAGLKEGSAEYEKMAERIRSAYLSKDVAQQAVDRQKEIADNWKKSTDQMNQSLTDALMRGFESGKNMAQSLKDAIVNMFKTMVLRPVVEFVVKGGLGALGIGGSTAANASQGVQVLSGLSTLNTVYQSAVRGFANLGAMAGSAAQYLQTIAGSTYGTTFASQQSAMLAAQESGMANTAFAQGVGSAAQMLGGAMVGFIAGKMISGGYSVIGNSGNTAVVAGTAIGAAVAGPIGAAIGGAIGGAINRVFGRKLTQVGITGTFGGEAGFTGQNYRFEKGGFLRSDKYTTSPLDVEVQTNLSTGFKALQIQLAVMASTLGQSANSIENFTYQITENFMGLSESQVTEKITEIFTKMSDKMAEAVLAGTNYSLANETATQTLTRLYNSLISVNGVMDTLNLTLFDGTLAGADLAASLINAFGSIENLNSATGFYYENFYTQAERTAETTSQLTSAFRNLGYELPATRDSFRQIIEALDLTTAAGRNMFTSLMSLAPTLATITQSSDEISRVNAENQRRIAEAEAARIESEARAAQAQAAAEAQIAQEQARKQAAIDAERYSLETKLFQIQEDTVKLRERELAALDPSNQSLLERIFALEDEKKRAEELDALIAAGRAAAAETEANNAAKAKAAAEAAQELAAEIAREQAAIADEKYSLETRLYQLQEDTVKLRERELAALDPSNKSLLERIFALEDEKKATEAAAQAQADYVSALSDSAKAIVDEINRLRGTKGKSLATLQTEFAIATASARAGDTTAAGTLAGLSQNISELVSSNANSSLEITRMNAYLASSLQETLGYLGSLGATIPQFAAGGLHEGGVRIVGENGPELEVTGAARYYTPAQLTGGSDVAIELRNLREDNKAQASALVSLQSRVTRLLERWDGDGLPETRSVA